MDTKNMTAQQFRVSQQKIEKVDGTINYSALKTKEDERKDNGKYSSFHDGLGPAILLCSNPATNFTIFDIIKIAFIKQRRRKHSKGSVETLGMFEAFLIGLIANSYES